jgi:hypothetical protein
LIIWVLLLLRVEEDEKAQQLGNKDEFDLHERVIEVGIRAVVWMVVVLQDGNCMDQAILMVMKMLLMQYEA